MQLNRIKPFNSKDLPIASIEKISTKIFPSINSYASSISIHLVHNTNTTAVMANKNRSKP